MVANVSHPTLSQSQRWACTAHWIHLSILQRQNTITFYLAKNMCPINMVSNESFIFPQCQHLHCVRNTLQWRQRDLTAVRTCFVYINHGGRINGLKYILFLGAWVMWTNTLFLLIVLALLLNILLLFLQDALNFGVKGGPVFFGCKDVYIRGNIAQARCKNYVELMWQSNKNIFVTDISE